MDRIMCRQLSFCKDHGRELCAECPCDYKQINDMIILEHVWSPNVLQGLDIAAPKAKELVEKREPLKLDYDHGAPAENPAGYSEFMCLEHYALNCECFDFMETIAAVAGRPIRSNPYIRRHHRVMASTPWLFPSQNVGSERLIATMSAPSEPRRFLPPNPHVQPQELFKEAADLSPNRYRRFLHKEDDHTILAVVDGAVVDAGTARQRAGFGIVFCATRAPLMSPLEGTIGGPEQTAERAALRAVLYYIQLRVWEAGVALRIVVATSCDYLVDGACKGIDQWERRGWTEGGAEIPNRDLWEALKHEIDAYAAAGVRLLFWKLPLDSGIGTGARIVAQEAAELPDRSPEGGVVCGLFELEEQPW